MSESYDKLLIRLKDLTNVNAAMQVLGWDQQVNMPSGGAPARAAQFSTLSRIAHEMTTGDETAKLLEAAESDLEGIDYDTDEASMLRYFRRQYDQATKYPAEFVAEIASATALAHEVWAKAREDNDFAHFLPTLEKLVDLMQRAAEYLGYEGDNPYDAMLDQYERGMTYDKVKTIFDGHKQGLIDLIKAVSESDQVDDSFLHQAFSQDKQREFGLWVIEQFGYDFTRGRLDVAVHPFATNFSVNDVRITTRFDDNWLNPALFGMMHEAGHGMYELGVAQALDGTPLAGGTSLGVHESQSRMWENIVGRSKGFWSWALPKLKETFPQLADVDLDTFYKGINKVSPSLIRVEADEATYNLHIMLRFELENDMMNGKVALKDLPQAWNERFETFLGITPPNDTLGVLQDVHWSAGLLGYFPTYALGNLLSVQYYNKAVETHPAIPDEIASGKFDTLLGWLRDNIHTHGSKFTSEELTKRVTGANIDSGPYIQYLTDKFGGVYKL